MRWVEVLDDHECHAALFGHIFEELFERLEPSCRCANSHDGKRNWLSAWFTRGRQLRRLPGLGFLGGIVFGAQNLRPPIARLSSAGRFGFRPGLLGPRATSTPSRSLRTLVT